MDTYDIILNQTARAPPKGMGDASGRALRLAGFQKHPNLWFPGSVD
jgi:hypothetical protein